MGQTTLTATSLTRNTGVACTEGGGTAINASNTMRVLYPDHGRLLVWIDSAHANTAATFAVGDFCAAGKGTLTHAVGNNVIEMIWVDTDRFKDSDGYVEWSWHADSAGFCQCFTLPQG